MVNDRQQAPTRSQEEERAKIFAAHLGGKIAVRARRRLTSPEALRLVYTPGVAEVCCHLQAHPEDRAQYTWLGRTVAIVTNGTAVLSLGHIGPIASLPVMEAKAALFAQLAGLNAVPILLQAREPESLIATVEQLAPSFGAIMLEDIESPACFVIERELQRRLAIPVLHADQHATAVVVLAALQRAAVLLGKPLHHLKVLTHGAGPTGLAVTRLLHLAGLRQLQVCDAQGRRWPNGQALRDPTETAVAALINPQRAHGDLATLLPGHDVLISTTNGYRVTQDLVAAMASQAIVLAMANPRPAIAPEEALAAGCAFALDGTTLNNALAFPGLFRGALAAQATQFTEAMLLAAADAIAALAPEGQLVPEQLDRRVHRAVARAVAQAAPGASRSRPVVPPRVQQTAQSMDLGHAR